MKIKYIVYSLFAGYFGLLIACEKLELDKEVCLTSTEVKEISYRTAKAEGSVTDIGEGIIQHGHCWSTSKNPTLDGEHTSLGPLNNRGHFLSPIENILPQTVYFVRSYVSDKDGVIYGPEKSFTTLSLTQPQVLTYSDADITRERTILSGKIQSLGLGQDSVLSYGHCWNTSRNPTWENSRTEFGPTADTLFFESTLTDLQPNKTYYARSYATNSYSTVYGDGISFTTPADPATIEIEYVEHETEFNIIKIVSTNSGGAKALEFLLCLDTLPDPDTLSMVFDFSTTFTFLANNQTFWLEDLKAETNYYAKAFVRTKAGWAGSNQILFTSSSGRVPTAGQVGFTRYDNFDITFSFRIFDRGGYPSLECGFIWSDKPDLTSEDNIVPCTVSADPEAEYSTTLNNFFPGDTLYIMAYATNKIGTGFSPKNIIVHEPENGYWIPVNSNKYPVSFQIGSTAGEQNEQPVHTIQTSKFLISAKEINEYEYCEFLNSIDCPVNGVVDGHKLFELNETTGFFFNGSQFIYRKWDMPVNYISWYGAVKYCEWKGVRLPTEAEWESAAISYGSAETYQKDGISYTLHETAWYKENSGGQLHSTYGRENKLPIQEMFGNVREWCSDWYDENYYSVSPLKDPTGPASGNYKVLRGGSYLSPAYDCRISARDFEDPESCLPDVGFRVVFDVE